MSQDELPTGVRQEGEDYPRTDRVRPTRHADRTTGDAAAIHQVLDEALLCHLGYVVDGEPVVLPTIHARVGRTLYLHASTGARLSRMIPADGLPVCVTVTLLDGLVLGRSQFHHSMNYRSVVVRGRARLVDDGQERAAALAAIVDHVIPGRSAASRPGDRSELAATAVLRVDLTEASLKRRSGPSADDEADLGLPYWAGVIPVRTVFGPAEPAADLDPALGVPDHVAGYRRPGGPVSR
ncbi:MAG TPA: pyridoxamine 5'-phosphate oxidase family protein [Kineosporiaceae bacterium]|nr:pyridoxamine 5'-phosphate oxidase family protein [Kineosporiaceae bacterium]